MEGLKGNFFGEKRSVLVKRLIIIIISSLVYSVAFNIFVTPHKLLSGGVTGIALIIQYLAGLNAGYTIIVFNIPLFFLSYKELDKEFTLLTAVGVISQSIFLIITKDISKFIYTDDILLSCVFSGVINGLSIGTIFKYHGSLGGTDIISMVLRKRANLSIGNVSLAMNVVIVSIGSAFFGVEKGLYTLIVMYILSNVLDQSIKGFNRKNLVLVVTTMEEEIVLRISNDLKRSATLIKAKGAYTKTDRTVIYCVLSTSQIPKLKQIVEKVDKKAFISILDASQVQGEGFDHPI